MGFLNNIFGSSGKKNTGNSYEASVQFVEQLMDLGYYKYATENDVEELKNDLVESIAQHNVLSTVYGENLLPKDYRHYMCDGETVYEEGGIIEILSELQRTFNKIGLIIEISNHHEIWDSENNWLDHWITINGKEYIIFKHFKDYGWGEAVMRLAEILNEQLQIQDKDEQIYLINGGNDGGLIFLTDEQYTLISTRLKDDQWRPLPVKDWCRVMQVNGKYIGPE